MSLRPSRQPSQEMGYTDSNGHRWVHIPWEGWRVMPSLFLRATPQEGVTGPEVDRSKLDA